MRRAVLIAAFVVGSWASAASAQMYGYGYNYGYQYSYSYGPPPVGVFGPGYYNPGLYGPRDYVYPTRPFPRSNVYRFNRFDAFGPRRGWR